MTPGDRGRAICVVLDMRSALYSKRPPGAAAFCNGIARLPAHRLADAATLERPARAEIREP